jgi:hypothetical protein
MTQATRKVRPINTVKIGVGVDDWTVDGGRWTAGDGTADDGAMDDLASNWKSRNQKFHVILFRVGKSIRHFCC